MRTRVWVVNAVQSVEKQNHTKKKRQTNEGSRKKKIDIPSPRVKDNNITYAPFLQGNRNVPNPIFLSACLPWSNKRSGRRSHTEMLQREVYRRRWFLLLSWMGANPSCKTGRTLKWGERSGRGKEEDNNDDSEICDCWRKNVENKLKLKTIMRIGQW